MLVYVSIGKGEQFPQNVFLVQATSNTSDIQTIFCRIGEQ